MLKHSGRLIGGIVQVEAGILTLAAAGPAQMALTITQADRTATITLDVDQCTVLAGILSTGAAICHLFLEHEADMNADQDTDTDTDQVNHQ